MICVFSFPFKGIVDNRSWFFCSHCNHYYFMDKFILCPDCFNSDLMLVFDISIVNSLNSVLKAQEIIELLNGVLNRQSVEIKL